jgi:hypothetical protein
MKYTNGHADSTSAFAHFVEPAHSSGHVSQDLYFIFRKSCVKISLYTQAIVTENLVTCPFPYSCGMSYVCRESHLVNRCIAIYCSCTEYTDELEELQAAGWRPVI